MISKKKANYTMTKGFSILCKALIIYIYTVLLYNWSSFN